MDKKKPGKKKPGKKEVKESTAITKSKKKKKQPLTRIPKEKGPELSMETVKKYINKLATDEEAYMFLQLCKAQKLNPFIKEAYLIKYSASSPGTMVVGKDVFTKRADHHPQYDGTKAGIILKNKASKALVYREGSFDDTESETLVGGWAETFRKDRKIPYRSEVSMTEYSKGQASWNKMPATMIRKVALVQSLREAFPDMFQGLYDSAEMGVELVEPKNVTDENPGPKETKADQPKADQPSPENVTPKNKKPEVIPPKKPMLPAVINIDDLCNLGIYEKTPMKYKSVPLGHLISIQKEAGNPEVMDPVIHYVIDEKISPLKNKLKYGEKEMIALIKADLNLDTDYVDLDQSNKIKVYRSLKILVDDMPAQEKK